MPNQIIIIHGWSDDRNSFKDLAKYLAESLPDRAIDAIALADWISLDDDVRYNDLALAMDRAWREKGLSTDPRSVDIVGHSTAALVVRDWMTTYYKPTTCPIHRHLMLAPANFGSPLAHKGKAWTGRIAKGFNTKFETGEHILAGLELASPYVWQLADRDLLTRGAHRWYGRGRILATCLIGNAPYDGVRAAISEDGSDGTVRVSGANPNVSRLRVASDGENGENFPPTFDIVHPPKDFIAFTPIPGETHSSITFRTKRNPRNNLTRALVADALRQTDSTWSSWCRKLEQHHRDAQLQPSPNIREANDEHYHSYQDSIVRVSDQFDNYVEDYLLEFKVDDRDRSLFARLFHRKAIRNVHVNSINSAYRSFYIDITVLREQIDRAGEGLSIGLTASPVVTRRSGSPPVGYKPLADKANGALFIPWEELGTVFAPDRTMLIDIQLQRLVKAKVFRIDSMPNV